jgi:hypothetical protein
MRLGLCQITHLFVTKLDFAGSTKMQSMKIFAGTAMAISFAFIVCMPNRVQAQETNRVAKTNLKNVYLPYQRSCLTGFDDLVAGVGDTNGTPLELKFNDSSENEFLHAIQDRLSTTKDWKEWNQQLVEELDARFSHLRERIPADDKLVIAKARFVVTRERKIQGISIENHSRSRTFESMIKQTIQSLDGEPILAFPKSSTVQAVSKKGRFTQNYGPSRIQKTGLGISEPRVN